MTPEEKIRAEERERVLEISAMCTHMGFPELTRGFIDGNTSLEQARKAVMAKFIAKKNEQPMPGFSPPVDDVVRFHAGRDSSEKRRDAIIDGFCVRSGARLQNPAPGANEYAAMSIEGLAKECLQANGERIRGLSADRVIKLALSQRGQVVADFPSLLAGVANKSMRLAYEQHPGTWREWCKIGSAKDFKTQYRVQLSEISDLDEVPEGTKYPHGELLDAKESFVVKSYGKIWAVTRQALVNDDLNALAGVSSAWGKSAARRVNQLVYSLLLSNPTMSDGNQLFSVAHANIGTGGAVSKTTLSEARAKMRLQKGPAGLATLNIVPKFLIAPAAIETVVDSALNSISLDETNPGIANPFYKKFVQITEPLLDATDTTAWYLVADPMSCDGLEVAFLNGQEAPIIEQRDGWNVSGIELKATIDVGCAVLDHRAFVFNEGE